MRVFETFDLRVDANVALNGISSVKPPLSLDAKKNLLQPVSLVIITKNVSGIAGEKGTTLWDTKETTITKVWT